MSGAKMRDVVQGAEVVVEVPEEGGLMRAVTSGGSPKAV